MLKIAIYLIVTIVSISCLVETAHHHHQNGTSSRRKSSKSFKSNKRQERLQQQQQQPALVSSKLVTNLNEPEFDAHVFEPTTTYAVNVSVMLGQNVVLPCAVRNIGSFKILWLRVKDGDVLAYDDMIITQDSRFSLNRKSLNESNLRIQSVKSTDSGEYACQINTQSLKAKLVNLIIMTPPYFIDSDSNNLNKDESLIQFYTNSFTTGGISSSSNYLINKHANHLHHHNYNNNNNHNKYVQKTFHHLPSTKSVNLLEGEQINLECNAFAIPKPEINWYVKKYQSSVLTEYLLNSSKLTVNNVTRNQYEYFECEATNKIPPSVSKKFKINVNYPPEITSPSSKVYLNIKNNQTAQVKFNCSVNSYPESDITWIFMNNDLLSSSSSSSKRTFKRRHRKGIVLNKRQSKEKYNIITQSINETFKLSSLVVDIENENDFGVYNCFTNNSMGNKTVGFYVYGELITKSLSELTTVNRNDLAAASPVQNQNLNKKELIIDDNVYLFSTTPLSTSSSSTFLNDLQYSKNIFKPSNFSSSSNIDYSFNSSSSFFIKYSHLIILFCIFLINMTI